MYSCSSRRRRSTASSRALAASSCARSEAISLGVRGVSSATVAPCHAEGFEPKLGAAKKHGPVTGELSPGEDARRLLGGCRRRLGCAGSGRDAGRNRTKRGEKTRGRPGGRK